MVIRIHHTWGHATLMTAAGLALVAATATAALASVPESSQALASNSSATIHACSAPVGQLRVIHPSAGQSCLTGETSLSWPSRATKPTYYVNFYSGSVTVGPGTIGEATAYCNSGDLATGGGGLQSYGTAGPTSSMVIIDDFPIESSGSATAWRVDYYNSGTVSYSFTTYVDCVRMP